MNDLIKIYREIIQQLEIRQSLVLATIISDAGSTPRTAGTRMIIRLDGSICGTIGGGGIEAEVIRYAGQLLQCKGVAIHTFDLTGTAASDLDMICGGRLTVLLEVITPTTENLRLYSKLVTLIEKSEPYHWVAELIEKNGRVVDTRRTLVHCSASSCSAGNLPTEVMVAAQEAEEQKLGPFIMETHGRRFWVESLAAPDKVLIFGAGHVSRHLARIVHDLHFYTIVLDDRNEFANHQRFTKVDRLVVVDTFETAMSFCSIDENSYIVIVTRGHRYDQIILAQALKTPAYYIGMIGSTRKRDVTFKFLLRQGFSQQDMDRVHCPIGLKIGGQTPEEIAVSIAAELIQSRTNRVKQFCVRKEHTIAQQRKQTEIILKPSKSATKIKITDAQGSVLAHDVTRIVPGKSKGPAFKRGHVIKKENIPELLELGKRHLYVLDLGDDELHEDDAALVIAEMLCGENLQWSVPSEGKSSIIAQCDGMLKVAIEGLSQINEIQDLSVATLRTNTACRKDQVVAATRIIPLTIEAARLDNLRRIIANHSPIITVRPFQKMRVGAVVTGSEIADGLIKDEFNSYVGPKLSDYGCELKKKIITTDDADAIAAAVLQLKELGCDIIVTTGGLSVDPDDVTAQGICTAGAEVIAYGSPVLPGAMFLYARLGSIVILGLPACVYYHSATIFDRLLPWILCKEPLTRKDIAAMGHGGLCMHCTSCHYPQCAFAG